MFPVRHSTVVVHGGEQLVIRKLVVVGVVSAEKIYIECLSVLKEVRREREREREREGDLKVKVGLLRQTS